jgi:hypothetical protein
VRRARPEDWFYTEGHDVSPSLWILSREDASLCDVYASTFDRMSSSEIIDVRHVEERD